MSIRAREIEELVDTRAYQELPSVALHRLLDAFADFIPSLEGYSAVAQEELLDYASLRSTGGFPEALSLISTIEPTVSRAIFEILTEIVIRDVREGSAYGARYEGWKSRGLLYGFNTDALELVAQLTGPRHRR